MDDFPHLPTPPHHPHPHAPFAARSCCLHAPRAWPFCTMDFLHTHTHYTHTHTPLSFSFSFSHCTLHCITHTTPATTHSLFSHHTPALHTSPIPLLFSLPLFSQFLHFSYSTVSFTFLLLLRTAAFLHLHTARLRFAAALHACAAAAYARSLVVPHYPMCQSAWDGGGWIVTTPTQNPFVWRSACL